MRSINAPSSRLSGPLLFWMAAFALCLLSPETALAQCAMCRDAVAAAPAQTRQAMNYAIMGLAAAPYGIGALAAWLAFPALRTSLRAYVRARLQTFRRHAPEETS
ncbi:MAG: hypothetical protein ABI672_19375 [Vicinamibacteria bacterium]